ncbi:MAG TPA: hypothetical protein DCR40_15695 [Prolixibacteraceae bacterium]|nr:hypothetical protein [Prolixibacteraceae bacterium]
MKVGIKIKREVVFLAIMLVIALLSKAQSNLGFYHTHDQFNSSNFNPAFLTYQQKFTFSVFPLAGMSVGYNNQTIIKDMLKQFLTGTPTKEDFQVVFKSLLKRDLFYQRMEIPILIFGHNSDWGSFDFRIKEVEQIMGNFKGNFSGFLMNPAIKTLATNQRQAFPANAVYYREYSLGYGKEMIKNKLTIGFRAKFYFGKSNVFSDVQGGLEENNGHFLLKTYGPARLSAPINLVQNSDSLLSSGTMSDDFTVANYLFNSKNMGTGIDLGINYQITPQLGFSASITDLGKITWKHNISNLNFKGDYKFPLKFIDTSGAGFITKTPDFSTEKVNLNELFKITTDQTPYSTSLPTIFFTGLQYQINSGLNLGLVDRYISSKGLNQNSISLTASYKVSKKMEITSGYSIIGNSFTNMPLVILYTRNHSQSFIGTDNFLSFMFPTFSDFSGITFGTSFFLFQYSSKYKPQLEYLPYFKEKKPKSVGKKGLIYNNYPKN